MLNNYAVFLEINNYSFFVINISLRLVLKSVTFVLVILDVGESRIAWCLAIFCRLHCNALPGIGPQHQWVPETMSPFLPSLLTRGIIFLHHFQTFPFLLFNQRQDRTGCGVFPSYLGTLHI